MFYFMTRFIGIVSILVEQNISNLCANGRCCDGYKWDEGRTSCIACPNGFIGTNCEDACTFPFYGKFCQSVCDCSNSSCDIALGCLQESTSASTVLKEQITLYQNDASSKVTVLHRPPVQDVRKQREGIDMESPVSCANEDAFKKIYPYITTNMESSKPPIACPIGFKGTQSEKPCVYPLYGDFCQSIKNQCNVATGCLQESVSEFPMSTSHRILPTSSTSTMVAVSYNRTERSDTENSGSLVEQCPSQLQNSNYVMKTSIFVLLGLAVVMLIIYFFVQVRFRKKVNTPIAII